MKLSKKLFVTGLTAAAFALVGCMMPELGNNKIISVGAGNTSASVNYTNDTIAVQRDARLTPNKHEGVDCVMEIQQTPGELGDGNGVVGYIFDQTNNQQSQAGGEINFSVIGFRVSKYNGDLNYYVSSYRNINKDSIDEKNFSAVKADGVTDNYTTNVSTFSSSNEPIEFVDVGLGASLTTSQTLSLQKNDFYNSTENTWKFGIRIEQVAGAYEIYIFKRSQLDGNTIKTGETGVKIATVSAAVTGHSEIQQNYLGYYCNVYNGETLIANWWCSDYVKEDIPVEE